MVREVTGPEIDQDTLDYMKNKITDFRARKVYGRLIFDFRAGIIYSTQTNETRLPGGVGSRPKKTSKKKQENP